MFSENSAAAAHCSTKTLTKMDLRALLLLGLCWAACRPALSLQCYIESPSPGGVFAAEFKPPKTPNPACVRYQFNSQWVYTVIDKKDCPKLKASPDVYKQLLCCSTNKCNAPSGALDPATKIVPKPAGFKP